MTSAFAVLCLFVLSVFVSQSGISIFGPLATVLLAAGWFRNRNDAPKIPLPVLIGIGLVISSLAISVFVSSDKDDAVGELTQQWGLLMLLGLSLAPLGRKRRLALLVIFLIAGIAASAFGIFQRVGLNYRAHGFTNPNHFAGMIGLAFIASACMAMHASIKNKLWWTGLVIFTALVEFVTVIFTMARGVWLASLLALCFIATVVLPPKRLFFIAAAAIVAASSVFVLSPEMRFRAVTIKNYAIGIASGNTTFGDRLYDWQGGFMMFQESPVLGAGTGDFREEIDRYVSEEKLPDFDKPTRVQAHNLFVQTIATQGAFGLAALTVLLLSLVAWGAGFMKDGKVIEGSIIAASTLFIIFWGFSESSLSISKVQAAFCFVVGIAGGWALDSGPEG
jgi:O-antigen ligase